MILEDFLPTLRGTVTSLWDRAFAQPYLGLVGHRVDERFVVVGNARTGSNFLLAGLNGSRSIRMYHEIFADHNRRIGKDFDRIFSTVHRKEHRSIRIVGFKLFYNHLTEDEWAKFLSHTDFKIIHLTRQNRLRTLISLEIAFKTRQWSATTRVQNRKLEDRRVTLETSDLISKLEEIEANEVLTRKRFRGRPILEVTYEELTQKPSETFQRIGHYLGVDDLDPSRIRLSRQNPEGLRDLIVNYAEVALVLKGTRHADYLER